MGKDIPIVINNFNRITMLKNLIGQLEGMGYNNIWILDNASTYPPLLEWYQQNASKYTIRGFDRNYIQNCIYDCGILPEFQGKYEWIVYTDPDLELNPNTPHDFVDQLIGYAKSLNYQKAGLAIKIDDLPDTALGNTNRFWEGRWWTQPLGNNLYDAQIDTTFAVIQPSNGLVWKALRVAGDFECRHLPWYLDLGNLDAEERHYFEKAHEYSTMKRLYNQYLKGGNLKIFS